MSNSVETLLNERGIPFKASGRDYVIKCLNPEHEDTNPSLRVDKLTGLAHCFSCGWRRNLFKQYGVSPPLRSIKLVSLKEKLNSLKIQSEAIEIPKTSIQVKESFRGISVQTLRHFGAFYNNDIEELKDRIVFPIFDITGKIKMFVARHLYSDEGLRYIYYPKHVKIHPYPVIIPKQFTSIIIVEGIFDMLNLYDKGIKNVVSVFGTNTLNSDIESSLLQYKVQGIHKVYILFDGDEPGKVAAEKIKPLIEKAGFIAKILELEDDRDPGDLIQEEVNDILEYISNE